MATDTPTQSLIPEEMAEKLFEMLQIDGTFDLNKTEDGIDIELSTNDSGIVIGYHGETLEALQLILALMIAKKTGEFQRVSIEVGDYKKNRTSYLEKLADQVKERVLSENREESLASLKSWERRVIHVKLQNDPDVVSESVGEGKDRVLVVKPKS